MPVQLDEDSPEIWCKLEYLNPSGTTKDCIARHILEKAWRQWRVQPGDLVVEASSGSTSIALAMTCAQMGLRFLAFIPDTATSERSLMIQAYGGEVRKVSGGMPEVIRTAAEFSDDDGVFLARQFENADNAEAHQLFTAHEIMVQLPDVNIDGCSKLFADWRETPGAAKLREVIIDDFRCLELTHKLWKMGFPVGPSSGLNLAAAIDTARDLQKDATIVTVFPDRMERYFSHKVFEGLCKASGTL
ncbi:pyridoxal-phosphate dependent enzyme [Akkermansiaceae bacterium]|nr:pyridoxal-phosphate dependent enzyme [Akkermansiaceae bacterium]MDB4287898.1 pyridoxal-phosphate dependent enzyme [bacterium]MDB4545630.1 pyridoxal-phosphate dependent enzyme [Akkermansiaceae bacterium]MDB4578038.1 pyridoxal-phosphate dependent enzyme [Akkermansiaceae bacterium]MDC1206114.1 pyridoxal-phosphate dependent enzyme [Akkermansiaceae bacterium]